MGYTATSLTIDEVMDPESSRLLDARLLLDTDYAELVRLRSELEDGRAAGSPKYVCPVCGAAIVIRCAMRHNDPRLSRAFHFWHGKRESACPLSQEPLLTREAILAAKYHGQREGSAHLRMKDLLCDSLRCDDRFTHIVQERRWRLEGDARKWRRPDVSCIFNGSPVVFEIQLSTTFVSVMAERRHFYREQGALLVWVVADFDPRWAALAHHDIFYPNNRNMFVVNELTLAESKRRGIAVLEVRWNEPFDAGQPSPKFHFRHQLIDFGKLTFDLQRQRTYYFDTDAEEARLKAIITDAPLRSAFERHWFAYLSGSDPQSAADLEWAELRRRFRAKGVDLPDRRYEVAPLLNSIYSARDAHSGQLVGWKYSDLVKLAHHLYAEHKPVLWPFRLALQAFDRDDMIRHLDPKKKWRQKVPGYLNAIKSDEPNYRQPSYAPGLLAVLFPTMGPGLARSPQESLRSMELQPTGSRTSPGGIGPVGDPQ